MSSFDGKTNPWQSLAKLIQDGIPVAKLATVIEKQGIQTFDRFGRRGPAVAGESQNKYSVTYALDQLAVYHAEASDPGIEREHLEEYLEKWFDGDSPLRDFGWLKDEVPDFENIPYETPPNKKENIDEPPGKTNRRSYLKMIALLCKKCKIDFLARGAPVEIADLSQQYPNFKLDAGTVRGIIKLIPDEVSLED